ncbi:MAG TPA: delta-60 repeat domain-containing protein [Pseudomonadales bacterium]|nr:delta-60 repeat domain-containing protein [Pseudomonadales bacterium]
MAIKKPIHFLLIAYLLLAGTMLSMQAWAVGAAGSLDTSFNSSVDPDISASRLVTQPDGKIIAEIRASTSQNNTVVRLNPDGSLDAGFNSGTIVNGSAYEMAVQPDGKIVIAGHFISYNGISQGHIARLNPDGSLDAGFHSGTGANGELYALAISGDGKIVIGGFFTSFDGVPRNYIAQLNADGSLDNGFNPGTGFAGYVYGLAVQSDGKILVGGIFLSFNGLSANRIARINPDGSLDHTFNTGSGFNMYVDTILLQDDGKILAGGVFTAFNGSSRNYLARLNSNGSLDTGFDAGSLVGPEVASIVKQKDGKILVASNMNHYHSSTSQFLRLNIDGSQDASFNIGTLLDLPNNMSTFAIQANGRVLLGGRFNPYSQYILRIHTGDADRDGIEDAADYFPANAAAAMDSDKDGLPDTWIQPNGFDCAVGATTCNALTLDIDNDNDGVPDYIDADPLNAAIHTEKLLLMNGTYRGSSVKESVTIQ